MVRHTRALTQPTSITRQAPPDILVSLTLLVPMRVHRSASMM